jgi:hypothetical protein
MEIDGLFDTDHVFQKRPVMTGIAIERAVYEFYLMDTGSDKLLELANDQGDRAEAHGIIITGKAILAVEGTAPGAFVVNNVML